MPRSIALPNGFRIDELRDLPAAHWIWCSSSREAIESTPARRALYKTVGQTFTPPRDACVLLVPTDLFDFLAADIEAALDAVPFG